MPADLRRSGRETQDSARRGGARGGARPRRLRTPCSIPFGPGPEQPQTDLTTKRAPDQGRGPSRPPRWLVALGLGRCLAGVGGCGGDFDTVDDGELVNQPPGTVAINVQLQNGDAGATDGNCQVVDGPYSGKTGTHDEDGACPAPTP